MVSSECALSRPADSLVGMDTIFLEMRDHEEIMETADLHVWSAARR